MVLPLNVSMILVKLFSPGVLQPSAKQHFRKEQQDSQVNYLHTVLKRLQFGDHFIFHDPLALHFKLVLPDN